METKLLSKKLHCHHQRAYSYLHDFAKELVKTKGANNIIRPNNVVAAIEHWDIENDSIVVVVVDVDIESISINEYGDVIIRYSFAEKYYEDASFLFSYDELYDILYNVCACLGL